MRAAGIVGVALLVALLAGCARGDGVSDEDDARTAATEDAIAPIVTITPADGSQGVPPTEHITAMVVDGQLSRVELRGRDGQTIDGVSTPDGRRWSSTENLTPSTDYVLTAVVRDPSGKESSVTSTFRTQGPDQRVNARISPAPGSTVDGDEPIRVVFDQPVLDRAAAERALWVNAAPPIFGQTRWSSDRELLWQPSAPWHPGGTVTARLDIFGRKLGPDRFGAADVRSTFRVAGSHQLLAAPQRQPVNERLSAGARGGDSGRNAGRQTGTPTRTTQPTREASSDTEHTPTTEDRRADAPAAELVNRNRGERQQSEDADETAAREQRDDRPGLRSVPQLIPGATGP